MQLLTVSRLRVSKGLNTAMLAASQQIVWEINPAIKRRATCFWTELSSWKELQGEALGFLLHVLCAAFYQSCAPWAAKEHKSLQEHVTTSHNGWGWKGPLEVISSRLCSGRVTYIRLHMTMPRWLLISCKYGDILLSRSLSLQLLLDMLSIYLPRATYHLVKQLAALLILQYIPGDHERCCKDWLQ